MKKDIFRIIDANLNRSREGLRVCEEMTRFTLNSPGLTKELKGVRHAISALAKPYLFKSDGAVESRDSKGDVGRTLKAPGGGMKRLCDADIFSANMQRTKESLRVLEEFFKLIDDKASSRFMSLRFKVYDIERRAMKRILK